MIAPILPPPSAAGILPAVPTDYIFRLSLDQYHDMIQHGILGDDDKVELLEGWLIPHMAKNPPHRLVNRLVGDGLDTVISTGWHLNTQEPITLETSEPEPDVSVVRGQPRDYPDRHPAAGDVGQVVEVSASTLARDRGIKKRVYARARIPVYWIVNIVDRIVEVYTLPSGPAEEPDYGHREDYRLTDSVPVVLDGQEVGRLPVSDFLS